MKKSLDVFNNKMKVAKFSFLNKKSYNKTVIDFNLGRHKDLSTRKSDNSPRPLIEVNNCIILTLVNVNVLKLKS